MRRLYDRQHNNMAFQNGNTYDLQSDLQAALQVLREFSSGQIREDQLREVLDYLQRRYHCQALCEPIRYAVQCEDDEREERYQATSQGLLLWIKKTHPREYAAATRDRPGCS